jgi:hypothetical protein
MRTSSGVVTGQRWIWRGNGLGRARAAIALSALGSDATGFGLREPAPTQRRPWPTWTPRSLWQPNPDTQTQNIALCWASFQAKPRQFQMLNADVGVSEKIGFMIGGAQ